MSGVDLLPAWPTSGDSEAAFNTKADALGPALSTMITQINTALGVTNISAWVSGAAYTAGSSVVWSLINFRAYRRKTTSSAGTTDPSLDATNWDPVDPIYIDASSNVIIPVGAKKITGDFSNATIANRVMFQTSTVNGNSGVAAIPNGTGTIAQYQAYSRSDPTNASRADFAALDGTDVRLASSITGTGTYLPMTFYTGGVERMRIDTSGRITNAAGSATDVGAASAKLAFVSLNIGGPIASGTTDANVNYRFAHSGVALDNGVYAGGSVWWQARSLSSYATNYDINFQPNGGNTLHVGSNGGLGYGTGSGGSVIQATSRTAAVALNKPSGDITLFSAAGSATAATFTVNNSLVSATDVPIIAVRSATNKYITAITNVVASTSFDITFWTTGGTATDSPIFHFNLGKGSAT